MRGIETEVPDQLDAISVKIAKEKKPVNCLLVPLNIPS